MSHFFLTMVWNWIQAQIRIRLKHHLKKLKSSKKKTLRNLRSSQRQKPWKTRGERFKNLKHHHSVSTKPKDNLRSFQKYLRNTKERWPEGPDEKLWSLLVYSGLRSTNGSLTNRQNKSALRFINYSTSAKAVQTAKRSSRTFSRSHEKMALL